jgi:ribosomal protein S8
VRLKEPQSKDKIQCQLCGKWFYLISWSHLLAKHNTTSDEYKDAFEIDYFWAESRRNAKSKWTKDKIIEEIKRRYSNGEPINYRYMNRKHNWLCVIATKKYFKDWKDAVEAAGIDYEKISLKQGWNRQNIIKNIIRLKKEGHPIYNNHIHRFFPNLYVGARFCFGGWRQAVEAAGIKYEIKKKQSRWTKEKVIAKLQEMKRSGEKTNRTYFRKNYPGLESAMIRIFKNWHNALIEAGIK